MFPDQIYYERLKSSPGVKTEYGLRIEHTSRLYDGGDIVLVAVERPNGVVDWATKFQRDGREGTIIYDNPEAILGKIKKRVADLYRIYTGRSIALKLLREM